MIGCRLLYFFVLISGAELGPSSSSDEAFIMVSKLKYDLKVFKSSEYAIKQNITLNMTGRTRISSKSTIVPISYIDEVCIMTMKSKTNPLLIPDLYTTMNKDTFQILAETMSMSNHKLKGMLMHINYHDGNAMITKIGADYPTLLVLRNDEEAGRHLILPEICSLISQTEPDFKTINLQVDDLIILLPSEVMKKFDLMALNGIMFEFDLKDFENTLVTIRKMIEEAIGRKFSLIAILVTNRTH